MPQQSGGGAGYDISLSDSTSQAASNSGSRVINNSTGANGTVIFIVLGVFGLFALIIWLKRGK